MVKARPYLPPSRADVSHRCRLGEKEAGRPLLYRKEGPGLGRRVESRSRVVSLGLQT